MSPLLRVEIQVFIEIAVELRRWADAMERHSGQVAGRALGPGWPAEDLRDLYEEWLRVGGAIRDVARTPPDETAREPRSQVLAIRDGLRNIADIVARQAG